MLLRTHLAFSLLVALLVMRYFDNSILFVGVVLIATMIPDLDSSRSKYGKKFWLLRPVQWMAGHRKIFHSLVFVGAIWFFLYLFSEVVAFGFLVGYGSHLFLDIFTYQGVMLFYPLEWKMRGFVGSGGVIEAVIFLVLVVANGIVLMKLFNIYL